MFLHLATFENWKKNNNNSVIRSFETCGLAVSPLLPFLSSELKLRRIAGCVFTVVDHQTFARIAPDMMSGVFMAKQGLRLQTA